MTCPAIRGRMTVTTRGPYAGGYRPGATNRRSEASMAITSCRHPGCDQPAIGACANCGDLFCPRHIWKADYGVVIALCYRCHEQAATLERARAREAAAYTVIVVLLL